MCKIFDNESNKYCFIEGDFNILGEELIRSSKFEQAHFVYRMYQKQFPESVYAEYGMAETFFYNEQYKESFTHFNNALKMDPLSSYAADMIYQINNKIH